MAVFFWILIGLTWLGGIISMLTASFHQILEDFSSQSWFSHIILNFRGHKKFKWIEVQNMFIYLQVPQLFLAREKQGQLESDQKKLLSSKVENI